MIIKNWFRENWRPFLFIPAGIATVYFSAEIIDSSPSLQFILQVFGVLFLIDIIWKVTGERRREKLETKELEQITKKYFDR